MSTDHKAYAFDWNGFAAAEGTGLEAPARYIWLGPRWYAWLEFGPDNRHVTFMAIGARVASELGGRLEEYLPNPSDDGKEYAKVVVGEACLLLMRKAGIGAALGAEYRDLPLLLRIATLYGAERRGWRWPLYQLWQRVAGGAKTPNQALEQTGARI